MSEFSRRTALCRGLRLVSAFAVLPLSSRVMGAETCVEPASEGLRSGLNYMDPAANPKQACGACGFFKLNKDPCGYCEIMTGAVSAHAHCDSWAAREG